MTDDDDTPVIDDGLVLRSRQIDWSSADGPPKVVQCIQKHAEFRSHARFDGVAEIIVAQRPCPHCGSHAMRAMRTVDEAITAAGELGDD